MYGIRAYDPFCCIPPGPYYPHVGLGKDSAMQQSVNQSYFYNTYFHYFRPKFCELCTTFYLNGRLNSALECNFTLCFRAQMLPSSFGTVNFFYCLKYLPCSHRYMQLANGLEKSEHARSLGSSLNSPYLTHRADFHRLQGTSGQDSVA